MAHATTLPSRSPAPLSPTVPGDLSCYWQGAEQRAALPTGAAGLAVIRALGQWVLDYSDDGRHQGFPFDRPYLALYHRCLEVCRASTRLASQDHAMASALDRLRQTLRPIQAEVAFGLVTCRLEVRCRHFDQLRDVLRPDRLPAPADSPDCGSRPGETAAAIEELEQSFRVFVYSLRTRRAAPRLARDERQALDLVLDHLDRHGFEGVPAAAALACNLRQPHYVALLCGDLGALAEQFSALDAARREAAATGVVPATRTSTDRPALVTAALPLADRRLVRLLAFRQRLAAIAHR